MSKISVIIPNYNCSLWIEKAINSCLIQKHLHEIIIVDDYSDDDSWSILQKFKDTYGNLIKIYKNSEKGGNNARNYGFSKSSGDYIQWLDADDYLLEGKFENQINKFTEATDADIVYSDWYMDFYENKTKFIRRENKHNYEYEDFAFEILADNWSVPANYLLKREIAEKLHKIKAWNPERKVAQDREYFTMAALIGTKFSYTKGAFCVYNRWNDNQVSGMDFKERLKHQLVLEQKFRNSIIANNYPQKLEKKYLAILNAHAMNACFYNPKLTIVNSFSFFNIYWKKIHWKKRLIIPIIYFCQHIKYFWNVINN